VGAAKFAALFGRAATFLTGGVGCAPMSRPLTLIASVVVLAAGGGVAVAAGSAPAQSRSHMIVCPLEPNDTITTTCCGPPVVTAAASPAAFVCCGTPQPIDCPLGLTLSSSADPSMAGQKITLTGRWPGGTAGQTVELFQGLPGAKTFSKVAHTKTSSLGDFKFVRKGVETNRKWYVKVGSEQSLTIAQQVKAVVKLTRAFDVHVKPNHACEQVLVQRRAGHSWKNAGRMEIAGRVVTGGGGRFCGSFFGVLGGGEFRAVFPGDVRNIRSVSNVITLP
jgi:hypothetical protein